MSISFKEILSGYRLIWSEVCTTFLSVLGSAEGFFESSSWPMSISFEVNYLEFGLKMPLVVSVMGTLVCGMLIFILPVSGL